MDTGCLRRARALGATGRETGWLGWKPLSADMEKEP